MIGVVPMNADVTCIIVNIAAKKKYTNKNNNSTADLILSYDPLREKTPSRGGR
jgi:hypothetical protein